MTFQDILSQRLVNEQLIKTKFKTARDLVSWFGAVQSQDYLGAKWALGQRLNIKDSDIEKEFNDGRIIRTHVMRPTWHFVAPEDILWMQELTSPRVNKIMNYYNKKLGLDTELFKKTNKLIEKVLAEGNYLTKIEIKDLLDKEKIHTNTQTLSHVISTAELEGIICSGPRKGNKFTYALISDRAPKAKKLPREDALKELVKRYFQSHGPATIRDFVWWSGLTVLDAKLGIEANKLKSETLKGKTYWFFEIGKVNIPSPDLYLLPNYDEFTIAYQDRDPFLKPEAIEYFKTQGNAAFWNAVIYKGEIAGKWKKTTGKNILNLQVKLFDEAKNETNKLEKEIVKLGDFFEVEIKFN